MGLTYRMSNNSKKSFFLHWNPKCRFWPTRDYETVSPKEVAKPKYEICSQCRIQAENEMREMANRPAEKPSRPVEKEALHTLKCKVLPLSVHPVCLSGKLFSVSVFRFPVSLFPFSVSCFLFSISVFLFSVSYFLFPLSRLLFSYAPNLSTSKLTVFNPIHSQIISR